jgi:FtsH-binding integral membrane protein
MVIGFAGAVLFSLYLIYQIQMTRYAEDTLPNAIILAVGIYMSIVNLFLSLLRIFSMTGGGGSSRR